MILLGIDPGTATTGYGLVDVKSATSLKTLDFGKIATSKDLLMPQRLLAIYHATKRLVEKYDPKGIIIERLFFNTNVKTAISVGQARGIYILVAGEFNIPVFEYTALQAKMVLTGYGRSDKKEVRKAVKKMLKIRKDIKPIDASDALAMVLCHVIKQQDS